MISFAWQTIAASRILDGLTVGGAVFTRHLHHFGLGFQGFTAFARVVFSPRNPFGVGSKAASAGTTLQSMDLLLVDAIHGASTRYRLFHNQNSDGFVGRNRARHGVTRGFGWFTLSAARSAGIFAFLLARRIIPFALFAKNETIFSR